MVYETIFLKQVFRQQQLTRTFSLPGAGMIKRAPLREIYLHACALRLHEAKITYDHHDRYFSS